MDFRGGGGKMRRERGGAILAQGRQPEKLNHEENQGHEGNPKYQLNRRDH